MPDYPRTPRSTIKRIPKRGHYDEATVHAILDAGFVAHVGLATAAGQAVVIPMLYGRAGHTLYLHGASTSRLQALLAAEAEVCITVTHLDGLVLARSAFHHSLNYRSVVAFGRARAVEGPEKARALEVVSEQMLPGRWAEVRPPNPIEDKATAVVAVDIAEASAKVRTGGPVDDAADYALPIWAGVAPCRLQYGEPEPDPQLTPGIEPGPSLQALRAAGRFTNHIARPQPGEYGDFYQPYLDAVPGDNALAALADSLANHLPWLRALPDAHWAYRYAPGKWSVAEVVLHIIDSERVFANRLLRISRGDTTALPGFDQDLFVPHSEAHRRSPASLLAEYQAVREASLWLLESLSAEALTRQGTASGYPLSARAAAWIMAGHDRHHLQVLRSRYAPA